MEERLSASPLGSPAALMGLAAERLAADLDASPVEAQNLAQLLERGAAMAIELERLASLGIWAVTRADDDYPRRLIERLKTAAPPVLFISGEGRLLGKPGVAVVGSRDVDEAGQAFAAQIGESCARCGRVLYSGGARGVDKLAMSAAFDAGGQVVGLLAESLERTVRTADIRQAIARGDLALATSYSPAAPFTVGAAMGRNKLIYALADYAVVVASSAGEGGTWAGAVEALKHGWTPVFVLDREGIPEGNAQLLKKGAIPLRPPFPDAPDLWDWLSEQAAAASANRVQGRLF